MHVMVLGAGYAGLAAAQRLARQVSPYGGRVTVVNARPDFVERPRLHQVAAGQRIAPLPLAEVLAPTGAKLVVGTATAMDPDNRSVTVDGDVLTCDTLVYALGSTIDVDAVPGVREHTHTLADPDAAERLHRAAAVLADHGGHLMVCGGGLTGVEAATELAEAYPALRVSLVSRSQPGGWLSPRGRDHVHRAFGRLGITVRASAAVAEVRPGEVRLAGGEALGFDACVWAGGFRVPPLAAASGLAVDDCGRVRVDRHLRSVSHPHVYAVGDAAAASGPWGAAMAYGCRTGGFMGPFVADAIADAEAGRPVRRFRFRYIHQCVSLGRRDAVIQFVDPVDESPRRGVLTGRLATWYKDLVLSGALWTFRRPGPYLPRRRRPVARRQPSHAR